MRARSIYHLLVGKIDPPPLIDVLGVLEHFCRRWVRSDRREVASGGRESHQAGKDRYVEKLHLEEELIRSDDADVVSLLDFPSDLYSPWIEHLWRSSLFNLKKHHLVLCCVFGLSGLVFHVISHDPSLTKFPLKSPLD